MRAHGAPHIERHGACRGQQQAKGAEGDTRGVHADALRLRKGPQRLAGHGELALHEGAGEDVHGAQEAQVVGEDEGLQGVEACGRRQEAIEVELASDSHRFITFLMKKAL